MCLFIFDDLILYFWHFFLSGYYTGIFSKQYKITDFFFRTRIFKPLILANITILLIKYLLI